MNFGTATVAPGARRLLARDFFGGVKDKFNDVVDKAGDIAGGALDEVKDIAGDLVDGAGQVVDTVKDGVKDAADAAGDAISGVVEDIGDTTFDQEAVFDVAIGQPGQRFNLFTDPIR